MLLYLNFELCLAFSPPEAGGRTTGAEQAQGSLAAPTAPGRHTPAISPQNENRPEPHRLRANEMSVVPPEFAPENRDTLLPRNVGRRRAIACPRSGGPSRRAFVGLAPPAPSLNTRPRGTVLHHRFLGLHPIVIYNFPSVKGIFHRFRTKCGIFTALRGSRASRPGEPGRGRPAAPPPSGSSIPAAAGRPQFEAPRPRCCQRCRAGG